MQGSADGGMRALHPQIFFEFQGSWSKAAEEIEAVFSVTFL